MKKSCGKKRDYLIIELDLSVYGEVGVTMTY